MQKAAVIPVIIVSLILVTYTILIAVGKAPSVILWIFCLSPFLLVWMVLSVLRYGRFTGRQLGEDEHWGYSDREDLHS